MIILQAIRFSNKKKIRKYNNRKRLFTFITVERFIHSTKYWNVNRSVCKH